MLYIGLFILGLFLLLFGAKGIVESAISISHKMQMSPLIVGITIVAIGTSLPEFTISFLGGVDNAPDLALGNIIGSNSANIGFILGLSILVHSIRVGITKTQHNSIVYLIVALLSFLLMFMNMLSLSMGILLILTGIAVLIWQVYEGKKGSNNEDKKLVYKMKYKPSHNYKQLGLWFLIYLGVLVLGGKLLVDNAVIIARLFNLSEAVIGMTLVAVGTSLPEMAVSLFGMSKHEEKLVIGNIIGSNIYNLLFGGGILALSNVGGSNNILSLTTFLVFSLILCGIVRYYQGKKIPRYIGITLLLMYAGYITMLFS